MSEKGKIRLERLLENIEKEANNIHEDAIEDSLFDMQCRAILASCGEIRALIRQFPTEQEILNQAKKQVECAKEQIEQIAAQYEECKIILREVAALYGAAEKLMGKEKVNHEGHEGHEEIKD